MSRIILRRLNPIGYDENSTCFVVDGKLPEDLAGFVQRVRAEKGLSLKDVEKNSRGQITASYVNKIENRYAIAEGVTPAKLTALARGLQIPEDLIFAVARGKTPAGEGDPELERDKELLLWMFEDLPRECQLDVMASVAGIHQRRSMSARIIERHEARNEARQQILEKRVQASPPAPVRDDRQVAELPVRGNTDSLPRPQEEEDDGSLSKAS